MKLAIAVMALMAWLGVGPEAHGSVAIIALPFPLLLYDPTNGTPTHTPIDINGDSETDYTFSHGLSLN